MIRKLLIATAGSAHPRKAVALGADIAAKYGAEVLLGSASHRLSYPSPAICVTVRWSHIGRRCCLVASGHKIASLPQALSFE